MHYTGLATGHCCLSHSSSIHLCLRPRTRRSASPPTDFLSRAIVKKKRERDTGGTSRQGCREHTESAEPPVRPQCLVTWPTRLDLSALLSAAPRRRRGSKYTKLPRQNRISVLGPSPSPSSPTRFSTLSACSMPTAASPPKIPKIFSSTGQTYLVPTANGKTSLPAIPYPYPAPSLTNFCLRRRISGVECNLCTKADAQTDKEIHHD